MALCAFSIAARLPNDAVIAGTKGSIKVCYASPVQDHLIKKLQGHAKTVLTDD